MSAHCSLQLIANQHNFNFKHTQRVLYNVKRILINLKTLSRTSSQGNSFLNRRFFLKKGQYWNSQQKKRRKNPQCIKIYLKQILEFDYELTFNLRSILFFGFTRNLPVAEVATGFTMVANVSEHIHWFKKECFYVSQISFKVNILPSYCTTYNVYTLQLGLMYNFRISHRSPLNQSYFASKLLEDFLFC